MKISIITFPTVAVNSKSWTGISSGVLISVPSLAASSTSDSSTTRKTIHTQLIWISPISDWHSLQSLVKTFHPTVVKITMQNNIGNNISSINTYKDLAMKSDSCFNPLTLMSDQDRISPYNINTISSTQVMRKKKISAKGSLVDPITNSLT